MTSSLLDELECARLMIAWTYHLDRHENDKLMALFVEDCLIYSPRNGDAAGKDGIRGVLNKRDPNRVTRHVIAAPFIEMTGPDEAKGVVMFTIFDGYKDQHDGPGPMPLLPPVTVGEFHQTHRRTPEGWRIVSTRSTPVFKKQ